LLETMKDEQEGAILADRGVQGGLKAQGKVGLGQPPEPEIKVGPKNGEEGGWVESSGWVD